jgi:hypothetical protein
MSGRKLAHIRDRANVTKDILGKLMLGQEPR